jgi:hypothetical protein
MSCSALNSLQSRGVYHRGYSCVASSSSSSLSPAAKAGIALGVILGVLLVLLVLWYALRARRHRKKRNIPPVASSSLSPLTVKSDEKQPSLHDQLSPLPSRKPPVPRKPLGPAAAQLDGRSIYEVPNTSTPVREYHELDAGPVLSSHQRPIHSEACQKEILKSSDDHTFPNHLGNELH